MLVVKLMHPDQVSFEDDALQFVSFVWHGGDAMLAISHMPGVGVIELATSSRIDWTPPVASTGHDEEASADSMSCSHCDLFIIMHEIAYEWWKSIAFSALISVVMCSRFMIDTTRGKQLSVWKVRENESNKFYIFRLWIMSFSSIMNGERWCGVSLLYVKFSSLNLMFFDSFVWKSS